MENNRILTKEFVNSVTHEVIGAAIEVHRELGSGLLESIYNNCLEYELKARKINFVRELNIPVVYKGNLMSVNYRCDFFVEDCLILECKASEGIPPMTDAQVLTYMKLLKAPKGLIVNFNSPNIFYKGQKTLVNEIFRALNDE